jgi:hypothetical protein
MRKPQGLTAIGRRVRCSRFAPLGEGEHIGEFDLGINWKDLK